MGLDSLPFSTRGNGICRITLFFIYFNKMMFDNILTDVIEMIVKRGNYDLYLEIKDIIPKLHNENAYKRIVKSFIKCNKTELPLGLDKFFDIHYVINVNSSNVKHNINNEPSNISKQGQYMFNQFGNYLRTNDLPAVVSTYNRVFTQSDKNVYLRQIGLNDNGCMYSFLDKLIDNNGYKYILDNGQYTFINSQFVRKSHFDYL